MRYDMPHIMEELQFGANIILMVWTYFRRGFNPATADWNAILATRNDPQKKCQYKEISEEQRGLMERLCKASGEDCESLALFLMRQGRLLTGVVQWQRITS